MNGDKNDIKPGDFPKDLNWTSENALESLDRLYEFANAECKKAIDWYCREKRGKQIAGYVFRVGSIVSLAVSGIIPVLGEIFKKKRYSRGFTSVGNCCLSGFRPIYRT